MPGVNFRKSAEFRIPPDTARGRLSTNSFSTTVPLNWSWGASRGLIPPTTSTLCSPVANESAKSSPTSSARRSLPPAREGSCGSRARYRDAVEADRQFAPDSSRDRWDVVFVTTLWRRPARIRPAPTITETGLIRDETLTAMVDWPATWQAIVAMRAVRQLQSPAANAEFTGLKNCASLAALSSRNCPEVYRT